MKDLVAIAIEHGYRQTFMQQTAKFQEFVMQFAAQNPTIYLEQIARQLENIWNTSAIWARVLKVH